MTQSFDCIIKHPCRFLISGASGSGKTELVVDLLLNHENVFENKPERIYVFYQHDQTAYNRLSANSEIPVVFVEGAPTDDFVPVRHSTIVFDDLQELDSAVITTWFTRRAHHHSCDVIYLVQNLFSQNKTQRDISLNSNYICLFRARRDVGQLEKLNYQLLGSGHKNFLPRVFKEATSDRAHSYLFVDLEEGTPDAFRFRDSVVPVHGKTSVYVPVAQR